MNFRTAPFLVGLAAAAILLLRGSPGPGVPAPGGGASSQATGAVHSEVTAAPPAAADAGTRSRAAASREYLRLYRDFLGIFRPALAASQTMRVRGRAAAQPVNLEISVGPGESPVSGCDLGEVARQARSKGYRLEFMIALVADPIDSGLTSDFDLAMSGVQLALADSGYQFDRKWLPWIEPETAEKGFRETAGMMLFRTDEREKGERSLLAVFLVGEAPKLGIHKQAFQRAVDFILELEAQAASPGSPPECVAKPLPTSPSLAIPILGPTYSGSAESLRLALIDAPPPSCFRIVTGSASAPGLEALLTAGPLEERVRFSRTVAADNDLAREGLWFLEKRLGWDLDRAALLVESDTAYGSYFSGVSARSDEPRLAKITRLNFPSGLFALRNAWEEAGGSAAPSREAGSNQKAFAAPKTALDVSLADPRMPVGVVPEMSPLTARIDDMAMSNLLRRISQEGFSYVGILATDVKDQLFLAEQIRRWAPKAILFVVDSNLLYVHPQYNATMFGTLTISSYPLQTEVGRREESLGIPEPRIRRQFASERQEGAYFAMRGLVPVCNPVPRNCLAPQSCPSLAKGFERTIWIAASGKYSMWPLTSIHNPAIKPQPWHGLVCSLGPSMPEPAAGNPFTRRAGSTDRIDLQLGFLELVLCMVSYLLYWWKIPDWAGLRWRTRLHWSAVTALLCLAGAALVALWLLKLLSPPQAGEAEAGTASWWLLGWLLAAYLFLAWRFVQTAKLYPWRWPFIVAFAALALLLPWLCFGVFKLWAFGDDRAFFLRARSFSGGMSPLVSLAWLATAVCFWLVVELRRELVRKRHQALWPLRDYPADALAGCALRARQLDRLLATTFPSGGGYWLAALALIVPPAFYLWLRAQPIGESLAYGRFFIGLVAGASGLALMAFLRFLAAWGHVHYLLRRIKQTPMLEPLHRVAPGIGWKPTQFGLYVPSFTALSQSKEHLERLVDRGLLIARPDMDLDALLKDAFAAASKGMYRDELASRDELNAYFDAACPLLAALHLEQGVAEFYAVRLIAYLRYVFLQLRYSALGAMGCGVALIFGAATYAFQPKEFATLVLWSTLAATSAAMLAVFVQMERNTTLSEISGTAPDKITFNWLFWSKILIYAILPLLGLVASQFPSTGRLLSSMLDPLTRLLGAG